MRPPPPSSKLAPPPERRVESGHQPAPSASSVPIGPAGGDVRAERVRLPDQYVEAGPFAPRPVLREPIHVPSFAPPEAAEGDCEGCRSQLGRRSVAARLQCSGYGSPVELRVLGELHACAGSRRIAFRPVERRLLAALAVRHPEPVRYDALADAVWGD